MSMSRHYAQLDRNKWSVAADAKRKMRAKQMSHATYTLVKQATILETGSLTNLAYTYSGYFEAVAAQQTKDVVTKRLEAAKTAAKKIATYFIDQTPMFKGRPVIWSKYMTGNESYWSYDCRTYKCVLPWRFTEEDEKQFVEAFRIPFVDPYEDGRGSTGVAFSNHIAPMRFYRCKDRTIILHFISIDC